MADMGCLVQRSLECHADVCINLLCTGSELANMHVYSFVACIVGKMAQDVGMV